MKISKGGIELLKQLEGFRDKAYQCSAGVWTIGYGETRGVKKGDTITAYEADQRLMQSLMEFETAVNNAVKVPLSQNQFDALVIFAYNVGVGAFRRSILLKRLNAFEYDEVPAQMLRWNQSRGKVNRGLINRRNREIVLWNANTVKEDTIPQAVTPPDKPLVKSRTIIGSSIAGVATIAGEVVNETRSQLEPLAAHNETIQQVFLIVALIGIALTIYARVTRR